MKCAALAGMLVAVATSPLLAHQPAGRLLADANARVRAEPRSAEARFARGELWRANRHFGQARADYRTALRLDPEFVAARLGWGACELDAGRPAAALAQLEQFLAVQPDHPEGLRLRARALSRLGRAREAAETYDRLLTRLDDSHPGEPEDYLAASRAFRRAGRPVEAQLAVLDLGIARCGPAITLELAALMLEERARLWDAALVRLDRIIARDPKPARWAARRAALLKETGHNQKP